MLRFIKHFLYSRKTCRKICFFCKHYTICKEDIQYEQLGQLQERGAHPPFPG